MAVFMAGFFITLIVHYYIDKWSGIDDATDHADHDNTIKERHPTPPLTSIDNKNLPSNFDGLEHVSWLGCTYLHVCVYCLMVVH